MKTFRGRITRSESGFIVLDSDSEDEVEPYFTPGNFDIIVNNNFNILVDDDDDLSSTYEVESEDDSPLPLEDEDILDFASVEDDEEDVSMEGFFAFGGRPGDRRRTRSMDSPGNNNDGQAQQHQQQQQANGQATGQATAGIQAQDGRPTSSRMISRGSSMTPVPLSPHSLAIGDGMSNQDINTLIFERPIPMNGFSDDDDGNSALSPPPFVPNSSPFPPVSERPRSPRSPTIQSSSSESENNGDGEDRSASVSPEYNRIRSPSYCPNSPVEIASAISDEENASVRFSNSSNASNSPERVTRSDTPTQNEEQLKQENVRNRDHKETETEGDLTERSCNLDSEDSKPCTSSTSVHDEELEQGENKECPEDGGNGMNPMVSDVEDLDENDDALRGDRIGATTYAERHVLKILIKWVQELPKYNSDTLKGSNDNESAATDIEKTKFLDNDFEEEMALLWDMSFEPDVMTFLVEHNILNIIRQTLDESCCERLTEITLGIMANILSQQSIVEDFSIHDASLGLVESVIAQPGKMASVPVLIQVFAVLRRITWFLRNVASVQKWMNHLISKEFLSCTNFILCSCTNAPLLANVLITVFTVLETLGCDIKEDDNIEKDEEMGKEDAASSCNFFGKELSEPSKRETEFEGHRPFCETDFVNSVCEGLKELMKDPKPKKTRKLTSTREGHHEDGTLERELADMDVPIPDGLIQNAILNGLTTLYLLKKTPNGREALRKSVRPVINFLLDFFRKFSLCTDSIERSSEIDYFTLSVNLISFCQTELGEIVQDVLVAPITTASKLMDVYNGDGEEDKGLILVQKKNATGEDVEHDGPTYVALVIHEYLASLADAFGPDEVYLVKGKHSKFFKLVDNLVTKVSDVGAIQSTVEPEQS